MSDADLLQGGLGGLPGGRQRSGGTDIRIPTRSCPFSSVSDRLLRPVSHPLAPHA